MTRCEVCSEVWQERYDAACKQYQRSLALAATVAIVAAGMGLLAAIIAALCVVKTQKFINEFEYVEETAIVQDGEGQNVAVVGDGALIKMEVSDGPDY